MVAALEVVVESHEAIIKRLKFENAALFGANKSLVKEIAETEDVIRLLEGDGSVQQSDSDPEGESSDDRCKKVAARALDLVRDAQFVLSFSPLNPLSLFKCFAETALGHGKAICDLLSSEIDNDG